MEITEIRAVVRALDDGVAFVEVEQGGCGRCHEKGGCGGQHLTQAFCSGPKSYRVANPGNVQVGDRVTVGIPAAALRYSANLAYGLPLLGVIAGAAAGMHWFGDRGAMLGGAIGLFVAWLLIRFRARAGLENPQMQPKIISPGSTL